VAEVRRREKGAGIEVDWPVDAFMKALALPGRRESLATDLQLRLLDLECCQDTAVGGGWFRGVSGGQVKRTSAGARPPKDAPRTHRPPASLRLSWHAGRPCAHARAKMRVRTAPAWASVSEPGTLCATQPRALDGWAPSLAARCQSAHVSAKAARRLQRPACLPLPCRGAAACARPGRASRQHEPPPRARARAPRQPAAPRPRAGRRACALQRRPAAPRPKAARRRTGEALVGPQRVYFLDEVTTGLDSATAHQVVSVLADLAHLESVRAPAPCPARSDVPVQCLAAF